MQKNSENSNTNMSVETAAATIRGRIIEKLKKSIEANDIFYLNGEIAYKIDSFSLTTETTEYWPEIFIHDQLWFGLAPTLCLESKRIYALCERPAEAYFPGEKGSFLISCESFHEKAILQNFSEEYRTLKTQEDWDLIFNEELNDLVIKAKNMHDEKVRKEKEEEARANCIRIPAEMTVSVPEMNITCVSISLLERFGYNNVKINIVDNKYVLNNKVLNNAEAVWLEHRVISAINDDAASESKIGMIVYIEKDNEVVVNEKPIPSGLEKYYMECPKPLLKYYNLYQELSRLSKYDSVIV